MLRLLSSILLGTSLLVLHVFADDPKPAEPKTRKDEFKALKDEFNKRHVDALVAIQAAKTVEERKEATSKLPKTDEYAAKLMTLVEMDPKDDLSCEILVFFVKGLRTTQPKIFELLTQYHVKNPKIGPITAGSGLSPPDPMKKLLEEIYNQNPIRGIKGRACMALAFMANSEADRGNKESAKKAEKLLEEFIKDFADVNDADGEKLRESAKKLLFELRNLTIGKTVPEFISKDLGDKDVKLSSYRGKVVVLDIWATWCGPCRAMIPQERELVKKLEGKPFALISISIDEKKATLAEFIKGEPMPWTHWWNGAKGGIMEDWNLQMVPTIFVVDAKGVIRYKGVRDKQLDDAVTTLLGEMGIKAEDNKEQGK